MRWTSNETRLTTGPRTITLAKYTFDIRVTVEAPNETEAFRQVNYLHNNPQIIGLTYVAGEAVDQADGAAS